MDIFRFADLIEVPWRNGGGVTRDIASVHEDGALVWRVSMADVDSDGAFSDFSGLMRILTVIDGAGMDLLTPAGTLVALPGVPVLFDGGMAVSSVLRDGALRDFNLFFAPDRFGGSVVAIAGPGQRFVAAGGGQRRLLHCMSGRVAAGEDTVLGKGDTALLRDEITEIRLEDGATILLVSLDPCGPPQAG
ncbi:hypothetical protein DFR52_103707 [Hoeflea marina]|uniref:HutD protein n=1 Tax=Hoeflea marina TaxID=274592 RepID=A0A317PKE2_9HYPH|nr:HutD family protein [Hoeflea marina]PWW00500.1 hypothetical protein DFR52_103707 [Hoeflea marina]